MRDRSATCRRGLYISEQGAYIKEVGEAVCLDHGDETNGSDSEKTVGCGEHSVVLVDAF